MRLLKFWVLAMVLFMFFLTSCKKEEEPETVEEKINFSNLKAEDDGNENNSQDIKVEVKVSGAVDSYSKVKIIVVKSSKSLDLTAAASLSNEKFDLKDLTSSNEWYLKSGLKDSDGENIINDVSYSIYLLATPNIASRNAHLSQKSTPFLLKDEIKVTNFGSYNVQEDITVDKDGNLFVCGGQFSPTDVIKINENKAALKISSEATNPVGNVLDGQGNLYYTNFGKPEINKVSPSGVVTVFANDEKLSAGGGLTIDEAGVLYNVFGASTSIYKIRENEVEVLASNGGLNQPIGLDYDEVEKAFYIGNFGNGNVVKYTINDGVFNVIARTGSAIGHLEYQQGKIFITHYFNHQVLIYDAKGELLKTIGTGSPGNQNGNAETSTFENPNGIGIDKEGKYLYVNQVGGIIRKILL